MFITAFTWCLQHWLHIQNVDTYSCSIISNYPLKKNSHAAISQSFHIFAKSIMLFVCVSKCIDKDEDISLYHNAMITFEMHNEMVTDKK